MKKIMIAAAVLAALTACNKTLIEGPMTDSEYGYINFGLSSDMEIVDTKAATPVDKTNSTYNVYLKKNGADQWSDEEKKYKEYSDITAEDLKVPAATNAYVIEAENYTEAEAESANDNYGDVRVKGASAPFSVIAGATTDPVRVTCTPVNAKVTVGFVDDFQETFSGATVKLIDGSRNLQMNSLATVTSSGTGNSVTYTHTADANTSVAYFNVDEDVLTWSIEATVGTKAKVFTGTFTVQENKWNMITFKPGQNGNITFDISADITISGSVKINEEVDPLGGTDKNN